MRTLLDLTEFMAHPCRSGIQRVCAEILGRWPEGRVLTPVKVVPDGRLVSLEKVTSELIKAYFLARPMEHDEYLARIRELDRASDATGAEVVLGDSDRLLVAEVFYSLHRIEFYERLLSASPQRAYFLLFDLLPWLHPEYFERGRMDGTYGYLRLVARAMNVAFISDAVKADYYGRLLRTRERPGPVLRPGGDGFAHRSSDDSRTGARSARSKRAAFCAVGTIEPRKNHRLILDAFEEVWREFPRVELAFAGYVGWAVAGLERRIKHLARANGCFKWHESPDDEQLRAFIERARATIFVSSAEGYGLPPLESLSLGVPVIATDDIPSLEGLAGVGIHRLRERTVEALRDAVGAFLNDDYLEQKTAEARSLSLPTWSTFAGQVADWVAPGRSLRAGQ